MANTDVDVEELNVRMNRMKGFEVENVDNLPRKTHRVLRNPSVEDDVNMSGNEPQAFEYVSYPTSLGELNKSTMNPSRHNEFDVEETFWLTRVTCGTSLITPTEFNY